MVLTKNVRLELEGTRWYVENFNNADILLAETKLNQSVYIGHSKDSVITIPGKINNLTIDNCENTTIRFAGIVSSCEIVNCKQLTIMARGTVPTIQVDISDGVHLYLKESIYDTRIINATTSNVSLSAVLGNTVDQIVNYDIPSSIFADQFVSHIEKDRTLKTINSKAFKVPGSAMMVLM